MVQFKKIHQAFKKKPLNELKSVFGEPDSKGETRKVFGEDRYKIHYKMVSGDFVPGKLASLDFLIVNDGNGDVVASASLAMAPTGG